MGLNVYVFRVGDFMLHWLPLWLCWTPSNKGRRLLQNLTGFAGNFLWGVIATRGDLDITKIYGELPPGGNAAMWLVVFLATLMAPG